MFVVPIPSPISEMPALIGIHDLLYMSDVLDDHAPPLVKTRQSHGIHCEFELAKCSQIRSGKLKLKCLTFQAYSFQPENILQVHG